MLLTKHRSDALVLTSTDCDVNVRCVEGGRQFVGFKLWPGLGRGEGGPTGHSWPGVGGAGGVEGCFLK